MTQVAQNAFDSAANSSKLFFLKGEISSGKKNFINKKTILGDLKTVDDFIYIFIKCNFNQHFYFKYDLKIK